MKQIGKIGSARILSRVMIAVTINLLIGGLVAPQTVRGQAAGPSSASQQTTVMVTDFADKSNFQNKGLVRLATDAVALELGNSERYIVLPRSEVTKAATDLNLHPPYDQVAISRLADRAGATEAVTGEIAFVHVDNKHGQKTVSVGLKVAVQEASSGDNLSGAAQVGTANARPGQTDDDSLAQEAVNNAAVLAVKQIMTYNIPTGTILISVGTEPDTQIVINRGSRDGIQEGMQMIVLRDRQRVGKIQHTQLFPTDSNANQVENTLGIQTQDQVRAVFKVPDFTGGGVVKTTDTGRVHRNSSGVKTLGAIAMTLLVGGVILEASHGNSGTTGVVAEADMQNNAPAVHVIWRDTFLGGGSQDLEDHVWRLPDAGFNCSGDPLAAVGSGQHTYEDFNAPFSYWNAVRSFLQVGCNNSNNGNGGNGGNGGSGNGTATVVTPAAGAVLGFTVGQTYIYQTTSVIQRPTISNGGSGSGNGGNGGNTGGTQDIETDPVNSGPVTPINIPLLALPINQSMNINLCNPVIFTWLSREGADVFQFQISTDRTFTNRKVIKVVGPIVSTAPLSGGVTQTVTIPPLINCANHTGDPTLSNDPTFAAFAQGRSTTKPILYWRIGGRNSGDRPGPVNWISHNPHDPDQVFRNIYSLANSFTPADLPPPPPGKHR